MKTSLFFLLVLVVMTGLAVDLYGWGVILLVICAFNTGMLVDSHLDDVS